MKKYKSIVFVTMFIGISNLYSQNSITINGTGLTIQNGISISEIGNIDIKDKASEMGVLNNSGIISMKGDLNNLSQTEELGNGEIIFGGISDQFIKGENMFGSITLNKPSGDVTLSGNTKVAGQIKFIKGVLNTSDVNLLTLSKSATVYGSSQGYSGANDSSYVNGPIVKSGNTNFIFPLGKASSEYPLHPLGIELYDTTTDSFIAEYFDKSPVNFEKKASEVKTIANTEYWTLKREQGNNEAHITLHFRNIIINKPENLVVLHFDEDNTRVWEKAGNTGMNFDDPNNMYIRSGRISSFSPFTYGSIIEQQDLDINSEYFNPIGGKKAKKVITKYDLKVYPNPNSGNNLNIEINKLKKIK